MGKWHVASDAEKLARNADIVRHATTMSPVPTEIQIAQMFDCSVPLVHNVLRRNGVSIRKLRTRETAERRRYIDTKLRLAAEAKKREREKERAQRRINLRWTSDENEVIRRLSYELKSDKEIAEALVNRSTAAVQAHRYKFGLCGIPGKGQMNNWQPKQVSMEKLKEEVLRPGIEDKLIPLLHFKGHANLGSIHRYWNLALLMMLTECEHLSHGANIALNEDFAHLCGPIKRPEHSGINSFFSRLLLKPEVTNNVPGLLEYAKYAVHTPIRLTPVSAISNERRHSWWRTFKAKPSAPKKFVLRESSAEMVYPFLIHEPTRRDEGYDLTKFINDSIPRGLSQSVRADLCQDMIVAILSGEITREQVAGSIREFTRKAFKAAPSKYGHVSFDAPLSDMGGRTLADVLA